jgi:hypothetical protein
MVYDDEMDYEDEQDRQNDDNWDDPMNDDDIDQDQVADAQDKLAWRRLGIVVLLDWLTGHLHW